MVRHVYYGVTSSDDLFTFSIYWGCALISLCSGAVVYSMGVYVHHHWGIKLGQKSGRGSVTQFPADYFLVSSGVAG